jgi:hypothetical protein
LLLRCSPMSDRFCRARADRVCPLERILALQKSGCTLRRLQSPRFTLQLTTVITCLRRSWASELMTVDPLAVINAVEREAASPATSRPRRVRCVAAFAIDVRAALHLGRRRPAALSGDAEALPHPQDRPSVQARLFDCGGELIPQCDHLK